jgi:hypothetical protein
MGISMSRRGLIGILVGLVGREGKEELEGVE